VADRDDGSGGVGAVEAGDGVAEADGVPAARLAAGWRMLRSPPEQGRSPLVRAVVVAPQSMVAIGVLQLVPWLMNLPKSSLGGTFHR
jgi:hypothetical protein